MDKAALRQDLRARRQALTSGELTRAAERATGNLLDEPGWKAARTVALHIAVRGELPTAALLAAAWDGGKRVALPRMTAGGMELRLVSPGEALVAGPHGIPEPSADAPLVSPSELDLVLAPGVAFDRNGGRLGQGGGDYDRLMAALPPTCVTIGWCHALQLVDAVPTEPHDQRVRLVITPEGRHPAAR